MKRPANWYAPWTPMDDAVLRGPRPSAQLATDLGRTYFAVIQRRKLLRALDRAKEGK